MAEPLKNHFGPDVPQRLAASLRRVTKDFDSRGFQRAALEGYEPLDLMARGRHIAAALARYLPADFERASEILIASLGPPLERTEGNGMAPFFYLPHVLFVARMGLEHFEASMRAHYELTQRFTAEFGIRPLIEKYPERCVRRFHEWTADRSVHVRRLVSEGTRPRLPWAARLRCFEKDPTPTIELLERLKDDPEEYVRRSVANHLNDIGKDHPTVLVDTARRWLLEADENRDRLIRHALRSSIKRADPATLKLLGYGRASKSTIERTSITPQRAVIGGSVTLEVEIENRGKSQERTLIDLVVHFVKSNGSTSPKVFKLAQLDLAPKERSTVRKSISLREMTTRKHFPGEHRVEAQVNGRVIPLGAFSLRR